MRRPFPAKRDWGRRSICSQALLPLWEKVPEGRMRGGAVSTMFRKNPYPSTRLQGFARELRKSATPHEDHLWRILRRRQFSDFKFRRQVPIGPFIADFVCHEAKLIV